MDADEQSKEQIQGKQLEPKAKMHQHTVDQGITLWEAQPLHNIPAGGGACDTYSTGLFSEVSHQKKVQKSCLLPR